MLSQNVIVNIIIIIVIMQHPIPFIIVDRHLLFVICSIYVDACCETTYAHFNRFD